MHKNNNDHDEAGSEFNVSIKELGGILIFIGSLVSAWMTLNNSQVETNTKLISFEKYYNNSLNDYKLMNEKSIIELKTSIKEQKDINKELVDQVNDLERSVTQIYRLSSRKK